MTAVLIDLSARRMRRDPEGALVAELRLMVRQYEMLDQVAERALSRLDDVSAKLEQIAQAFEAI